MAVKAISDIFEPLLVQSFVDLASVTNLIFTLFISYIFTHTYIALPTHWRLTGTGTQPVPCHLISELQ